MDKKDLKWYESPVMEAVELEVEAQILAGSGETNAENADVETPSEETLD